MIYDSSTHVRNNPDGGLIPLVAIDNSGNAYGGLSPFSPYITDTAHIKVVSSTEQFSISGYPFSTEDGNWINTTDSLGYTITHLTENRGMRTQINSSSTSIIKRQSAKVFTYAAGNDHEITFATRYSIQQGCIGKLGYFDNHNGLYFQFENVAGQHTVKVVRRYRYNNATIENVVAREDWNIDKLDGKGISGKTLNPDAIQMPYISFTWYGGGSAVFGFKINREMVPVHVFSAGNNLAIPIISEPNQPFRIELYNTNTTAGDSYIDIWGLHLAINGSDPAQRIGYPFSARTLNRTVFAGSSYHLLSIRPNTTFKGINNRAWINIRDISLWGNTEGSYRIIYNPIFTDPLFNNNWQNADTNNSFTSFNTFNSPFTNGRLFHSGGFSSAKGGDSVILPEFKEPLTPLSDFTATNHISIIFDCTANGTINASFNWSEIQ